MQTLKIKYEKTNIQKYGIVLPAWMYNILSAEEKQDILDLTEKQFLKILKTKKQQ